MSHNILGHPAGEEVREALNHFSGRLLGMGEHTRTLTKDTIVRL